METQTSQSPGTAWYVIHTKPRQEEIALIHLMRQGYECYLPKISVERIRRGKAGSAIEAMFPRYLFIHLDTSQQGQSWAPIRSTQGVSQMVRFGTEPARIHERIIELIRTHEAARPEERLYQAGDAVEITAGPFKGIQALYQTTNAERRALVLLEILSKPVALQIDLADLKPS